MARRPGPERAPATEGRCQRAACCAFPPPDPVGRRTPGYPCGGQRLRPTWLPDAQVQGARTILQFAFFSPDACRRSSFPNHPRAPHLAVSHQPLSDARAAWPHRPCGELGQGLTRTRAPPAARPGPSVIVSDALPKPAVMDQGGGLRAAVPRRAEALRADPARRS
jgi:hypothetical protein